MTNNHVLAPFIFSNIYCINAFITDKMGKEI